MTHKEIAEIIQLVGSCFINAGQQAYDVAHNEEYPPMEKDNANQLTEIGNILWKAGKGVSRMGKCKKGGGKKK